MTIHWMQTVSGKRFDLVHPDPDTIDIRDIAYALSKKCRFNGHPKVFLSVAEHSIWVSRLFSNDDRLALAGLLHDANEAYLPDVPSPVKNLLPDYHILEDRVQEAIERKFGLFLSNLDRKVIKWADNIMLVTEARDFMGNTEGWGLAEPPMPESLTLYLRLGMESFLRTAELLGLVI